MRKSEIISNTVIIKDEVCNKPDELLGSFLFDKIVSEFIYKERNNFSYENIYKKIGNSEILQNIKELFLNNKKYDDTVIKDNKMIWFKFINELYNYYRRYNRFLLLYNNDKYEKIIKISDKLNSLLLYIYRFITQKLIGEKYLVYRQLPAFSNATFSVIKKENPTSYKFLDNIDFVSRVLIRPPFVINTESNIRKGSFTINDNACASSLNIVSDKFLCFGVYVGKYSAFIYFNIKYIALVSGIVNLFEIINISKFKTKPDLICFFGIEDNSLDGVIKKDGDTYLGFVSDNKDNDYFGYLKKMLLTLHNLKNIDRSYLPIHGAGVSIVMQDGSSKVIVMIGDSGVGKSETLEALRKLNSINNTIKEIYTIYDDMGSLYIKDGFLCTSGSEVGAFVRLDDLDNNYAYSEIDRAIFMNTNKNNARVIVPISDYESINNCYKVDIILNINNFAFKTGIETFNNSEEAIKRFIEGDRYSKGTTEESGLTKTFFSNPFGPLQRKEDTLKLINEYFEFAFCHNIFVGTLYTKLAIHGYEILGPAEAAAYILEIINNKEKI
ncbi:MAG: hypothetical protein LBV51_00435 [Acholeplasmatales bacterium]|jgi:hypothetical protein|nr:hypothetical protein [Acholeplasmatales bacterium]